MAIIVEEKRESNVIPMLIWLSILAIIIAVIYYIFFKRPQIIETTQPTGFQYTEQLSKINLNSEDVVNNPAFQALKNYIPAPQSGNAGRSNPFLGF